MGPYSPQIAIPRKVGTEGSRPISDPGPKVVGSEQRGRMALMFPIDELFKAKEAIMAYPEASAILFVLGLGIGWTASWPLLTAS